MSEEMKILLPGDPNHQQLLSEKRDEYQDRRNSEAIRLGMEHQAPEWKAAVSGDYAYLFFACTMLNDLLEKGEVTEQRYAEIVDTVVRLIQGNTMFDEVEIGVKVQARIKAAERVWSNLAAYADLEIGMNALRTFMKPRQSA